MTCETVPDGASESNGFSRGSSLNRPMIDHAAVETCCRHEREHLARRHDPFARYFNRQYIFADRELKGFVINIDKIKNSPPLQWLETATGKEDEGFVSLAAHIWQVDANEAAYRLARFMVMAADGCTMKRFLLRDSGERRLKGDEAPF